MHLDTFINLNLFLPISSTKIFSDESLKHLSREWLFHFGVKISGNVVSFQIWKLLRQW